MEHIILLPRLLLWSSHLVEEEGLGMKWKFQRASFSLEVQVRDSLGKVRYPLGLARAKNCFANYMKRNRSA